MARQVPPCAGGRPGTGTAVAAGRIGDWPSTVASAAAASGSAVSPTASVERTVSSVICGCSGSWFAMAYAPWVLVNGMRMWIMWVCAMRAKAALGCTGSVVPVGEGDGAGPGVDGSGVGMTGSL